MFRPRPGWGGQLRRWLHDNLYMAVFRLLIVSATVLIVSSLIHSWKDVQLAHSPSPTTTPATAVYEFVADHGIGLTQLAARAVDAYLNAQNVRLDAVRHLYAVDSLARTAGWRRLTAGEKVTFDTETLARAVISAKALTSQQYFAWSRLLR